MFRISRIARSIKPLHLSQPFNKKYIMDTDIGGDIDDGIATLLALSLQPKPLAITTTHIEPEEKAKIAKLIVTECGYPDIPVFAGVGSKRTESKEDFLRKNSLFPPAFGFPKPQTGEKTWYEKQGHAYKTGYANQFDSMKTEKETAPEFIARTARQFSPNNKLTISTLGPLHNIEAALRLDSSIANNMRLVAMGGSYPKGYNWLISPETSSFVLSKVETLCVSSEFISQSNLSLSQQELREIELSARSHFGKTFIEDWKNWHKGDIFGKKATFLYDPVTIYLALHPEEIISSSKKKVTFPCLDENRRLKPEFRDCWYYKPGLENKIIRLEDSKEANVTFIEKVRSPEKIKNEIIDAIKQAFSAKPTCKP